MTPDVAAPPSPRHLLSLRALESETWTRLLEDAETLATPAGRAPRLAGRRLGLLMLNASLRTRMSFEVACHDLGATPLDLGAGLWTLEHRDDVAMTGAAAEHVREAAGVLSTMVDGLGLRCFARLHDAAEDAADPVLHAFAAAARVPVLNLESAIDHPHQGLADALTVRRRTGGGRARIALTWAPHVKPLPLAVPHAALVAFVREGHDVVLAHPPGFELDEQVLTDARAFGSVEVTDDRRAALNGADFVYAKSWGPRGLYGDADAGAREVAAHPDWRVRAADLDRDTLFMHCLPVRRGVVVDPDVLDSPRSIVLEQAAARVHVQKATLCHAFGVRP